MKFHSPKVYLGIRNVNSEKFILYTMGNCPFPRSLMDVNHQKEKKSKKTKTTKNHLLY